MKNEEFFKQGMAATDLRARFFHLAFTEFEKRLASNYRPLRAKREIILQLAGYLGSEEAPLRQSFNRKLKAWRAAGKTLEAIEDKRPAANKRRTRNLQLAFYELKHHLQNNAFGGRTR